MNQDIIINRIIPILTLVLLLVGSIHEWIINIIEFKATLGDLFSVVASFSMSFMLWYIDNKTKKNDKIKEENDKKQATINTLKYELTGITRNCMFNVVQGTKQIGCISLYELFFDSWYNPIEYADDNYFTYSKLCGYLKYKSSSPIDNNLTDIKLKIIPNEYYNKYLNLINNNNDILYAEIEYKSHKYPLYKWMQYVTEGAFNTTDFMCILNIIRTNLHDRYETYYIKTDIKSQIKEPEKNCKIKSHIFKDTYTIDVEENKEKVFNEFKSVKYEWDNSELVSVTYNISDSDSRDKIKKDMRLASSHGNVNVDEWQINEFIEYTKRNNIIIKKIRSTYTIDVVDYSKFTDIQQILRNFELSYSTTSSGQGSEIIKLDNYIIESNPDIFKPMNS